MNRPAGSPLVGQAPAAEKTVTHSAALPYVDNWTLRPRPGAEASWTQLGLYENMPSSTM